MRTTTRTHLFALAAGVLAGAAASAPLAAEGAPGAGAEAIAVAPLPVDRAGPLAAALPDGSVAVIGGHGDSWYGIKSAAVRSPDGTWTTVATESSHDLGAVTRLPDGSLLAAGGAFDAGGGPGFPGVDRIDAAGAATELAYMRHGRSACAAATLLDGRVLVVGGRDAASAAHGEIYSVAADAWTDTGALRTPRAAPIVVPCQGGMVIVFSGTAPEGGPTYTSVEMMLATDLTFTTVQSNLIVSDAGWLPMLGTDLRRPVEDQTIYDGRFVFLAHRPGPSGETYALFTVDPKSREFELVPTDDPLPGDRWYESPLVDPTGRVAYLVAHAVADPAQVQLVAVELVDGTVTVPAGWIAAPGDQTLDLAGRVSLPDGRLLFAGGLHASAPSHFEANGAVTVFDPDVKAEVPLPEAPQDLTVRAVGAPALQLEWADLSTWETGFRVERRTPGGEWAEVATTPRDTTAWVDDTVAVGASYEYHVCAYNPTGASAFTPDVAAKAPAGKAKSSVKLDFGRIRTATTKVKSLKVQNLDRRAEMGFEIRSVEGPFDVTVGETFVLGKGKKVSIPVTFRAPGEKMTIGKLVLATSDPKRPIIEIKLVGRSK